MKTLPFAVILALGLLSALPAGAQNLIHRYSFNGNANDSVGTAHGSVVGGVTVMSEPNVNGSAVFPGGTSGTNPAYISLPVTAVSSLQNATVEIFTTNFTIPNSSGGVGGPYQALFSVATAYGDSTNYSVLAANRGSGGLGTGSRISNNGETVVAAHDDLPTGQGNHIIDLVYSGFTGVGSTGTETIYVDGTQVAQGTTTLSFADIAASASGIKVVGIGGGSPFNDPTYIGAMNEVRIFDNALNADQMAAEIADGPAIVGMVSITSVSPTVATAGAAGFTLTVNGTGFTPASTAAFGTDTSLTPTYVSPTELTLNVPAADITNAGNITVKAATPSTGGGQTATATFTVLPALTNITAIPLNVTGGNSANSTVTLNVNAAANTVVTLKSSNTAALTVPASVTIAGGSKTATFTATSFPVAVATPVTITATYRALSKTTTINVNPATLTSVTLNPISTAGGLTVNGTVTMTGPVAVNTAVALTSSNTAALTVPVSVTVPAGSATATFTATSHAVTSPTNVTVTATANAISRTKSLTVNPAALASLTFTPSVPLGGLTTTGTVTMTGSVAANTVVALTSSAPSALSVPTSVTVPAGATTATFTATSKALNVSATITVTATYKGVRKTVTMTVLHPLSSLILSPTAVLGGVSNATGTLTLTLPAPAGGVTVALSSSNTAALTVPASVTVAGGSQTATFTATSKAVATNPIVTVTATYLGAKQTTTVTVLHPLYSLAFSPTAVLGGASNVTGSVTLTLPAPAGGVTVALSSSNTAALTVPASVTVAAGSKKATFTAKSTALTTSASVTVTASFSGVSKTATVTVLHPLSPLTLSPSTVLGGAVNPVGSVTLTLPAPAGGVTVALSSSNTAALTVPASITVAGGARTGTFTATSKAVATNPVVMVTATYLGVSQTASVTVLHPLSSFTLSPTAVLGGASNVTGSVTLTTPAPPGGVTVTLSSSNTAALTVPASVTVAAGSKTATFTATSKSVASSSSVTVTASFGIVSQTATVMVK